MSKTGFRVTAVMFAAMMFAVCTACSFSASSRSSSSSCRSSSKRDKSEADTGKEAEKEMQSSLAGFQEEIAAIAVLYSGSSGLAEDFQRDISAAAKRNGIPYWELDERVFTAIGIGLKRAGVKRETIPSLPFLQGVKNAAQFNAIGKAYDKGN